MNRLLRYFFWVVLCCALGCNHLSKPTRLEAVKLAMINAPSVSVAFYLNFNSDVDGNFNEIIFEREMIHKICDAVVAKTSSWTHRKELLPMLTFASLSVKASDSEAQIYIVASDTIVFTENKKDYYYGKTEVGLWEDILSLTNKSLATIQSKHRP